MLFRTFPLNIYPTSGIFRIIFLRKIVHAILFMHGYAVTPCDKADYFVTWERITALSKLDSAVVDAVNDNTGGIFGSLYLIFKVRSIRLSLFTIFLIILRFQPLHHL